MLGLLMALAFLNYLDRNLLFPLQPLIRDSLHISEGAMGTLSSGFFIVYAVTAPLSGYIADRVPRKRVMLLIYLLVAAAIPLLLVPTAAPGAATMYLFAAIFGLGLGGEYLIIPLMAGELFGVSVLGRVMGIVLTADGVAEATAPMLVGYLRDRTGSYHTGFFLLVAIALVGAAAIAMLPGAQRAQAARVN